MLWELTGRALQNMFSWINKKNNIWIPLLSGALVHVFQLYPDNIFTKMIIMVLYVVFFQHYSTFTFLWSNSADKTRMIFFLFFPENRT